MGFRWYDGAFRSDFEISEMRTSEGYMMLFGALVGGCCFNSWFGGIWTILGVILGAVFSLWVTAAIGIVILYYIIHAFMN